MTEEETPPIQIFRVPSVSSSSPPEQWGILAVKDPHREELVIRWSEVQAIWPRARRAMNATTLEPFLCNEKHEPLSPALILYRTGTILDLVMEEDGVPPRSPSPPAFEKHACLSATISSRLSPPLHRRSLSGSRPSSPQSLPIDFGAATTWLVPDSPEDQVFPELYSLMREVLKDLMRDETAELLSGFSKAVGDNQAQEARNFKDMMQVQMEKEGVFQAQILEITEAMATRQKQMDERITRISTQIQAVLTQNFELHEYSIPRLFIVLPKIIRRRDVGHRLFSKQFRLYFLCECGRHTTKHGAGNPDVVHLAKHKGYDLSQPKLFFKKYGKYVLAMLNMVKFGITAAGIVVPSLAHFKIAESLNNVSDQIGFTEDMCGGMVDHSISFIEDQMKLESGTIFHEKKLPLNSLNRIEALEGAELRQLRRFLNDSDKAGTLGNLFKTVTDEGRVKWVCQDHFRAKYRESSQKAFLANVDDNGGKFNPGRGFVQIDLKSKARAKEFYSVLENARGVHELEAILNWECTMDDFKALSSAIGKSAVVSLKLQCCAGNPSVEILNSKRRHTPLIQLLANNRLQSVAFEFAPSVLSRVDLSAIPASALHLRHLSLNIEAITPLSSVTTLSRILKCCDALQSLRLRFSKTCEYKDILAIVETALKESSSVVDLSLVCLGWEKLLALEQSVIQLWCDLNLRGNNDAAFRTLHLEDFIDVAQVTINVDNDGILATSAELKPIILQEHQHSYREVVKGEQRKLFLQSKGHHLDSLAAVNEKYVFPGMFLDVLSAIEGHQGESSLTSVFIRTGAVTLSTSDSLWKIIQRSPRLTTLKVEFSHDSKDELSQNVLTRLGPFATEVGLSADLSWLSDMRCNVDRSLLPKMTVLSLCATDEWNEPCDLSLLLELISLPALSSTLVQSACTSSLGQQSEGITSLTQLEIRDLKFGLNDNWARLFQAVDFSTLEYLIICDSLLSHDDFGALLNVVPFPDSSNQGSFEIALRGLAVVDTLAEGADIDKEVWRLQLQDKAPGIDFASQHEITGAEKRFGPLAIGCSEIAICW